MIKNIEISQKTLTKLKILSAFENKSVKALMENAVEYFIAQKEKERYEKMSDEEKEDLGLWILMQEAMDDEYVSEEEFFKALNE